MSYRMSFLRPSLSFLRNFDDIMALHEAIISALVDNKSLLEKIPQCVWKLKSYGIVLWLFSINNYCGDHILHYLKKGVW